MAAKLVSDAAAADLVGVWSRLRSDRRAGVVAAWAVAGTAGGVFVSATAAQVVAPLIWLAIVGGVATGSALGLRGLAAVGAGLLGYGVAAALMQVLGGVGGGLSAVGTVSLLLYGTGIWLWAASSLLLAVGAHYLVGRQRNVSSEAAGPSPRRFRPRQWAGYWLLAALVFPPINLILAARMLALGPGAMLLVVALFIIALAASRLTF